MFGVPGVASPPWRCKTASGILAKTVPPERVRVPSAQKIVDVLLHAIWLGRRGY
jgi:hypothetical protein